MVIWEIILLIRKEMNNEMNECTGEFIHSEELTIRVGFSLKFDGVIGDYLQ